MSNLLMERDLHQSLPYPIKVDGYHFLRHGPGAEVNLESLAETLSLAFGQLWSLSRVRSKLFDAPAFRWLYVAEQEGGIVSCAGHYHRQDPEYDVINWVATHPEHARRGLAQNCVCLALLSIQGAGKPRASLETDEQKMPAIRLYLKLGFEPVFQVGSEDHTERWRPLLGR